MSALEAAVLILVLATVALCLALYGLLTALARKWTPFR